MLIGATSPDPNHGLLILDLTTKRGNRIPNVQRRTRPPASMAAARDIVIGNHPTAKVRSLRSEYNCVGLVFASRRTHIEPEHVATILREDGFRRVNREEELEIGDVVIYRTDDREISHVGLIAKIVVAVERGQREITVLSQWGADGEYFHHIDDVNPNLGRPAEFWTDRT